MEWKIVNKTKREKNGGKSVKTKGDSAVKKPLTLGSQPQKGEELWMAIHKQRDSIQYSIIFQ